MNHHQTSIANYSSLIGRVHTSMNLIIATLQWFKHKHLPPGNLILRLSLSRLHTYGSYAFWPSRSQRSCMNYIWVTIGSTHPSWYSVRVLTTNHGYALYLSRTPSWHTWVSQPSEKSQLGTYSTPKDSEILRTSLKYHVVVNPIIFVSFDTSHMALITRTCHPSMSMLC